MTVSQLMEKLKELPPNVPVFVDVTEGFETDAGTWLENTYSKLIVRVSNLETRVILDLDS